MPWTAVEKEYRFEGPNGPASLLDLFEGRRQLIVYRAFAEPGVTGWPEHAGIGCSLIADHVAPVAHLNVRDTTLAFVSRGGRAKRSLRDDLRSADLMVSELAECQPSR